ncbi:hydantoinase B/oxoprolinase family protein [Halovivax gelatinilyticus]|uniref:hydantoinase B/oxoprolinase family protein n=1 Tax=Halovivax gelatinilyticus TaxID=2961597 RepID=UPI0020CA5124|nr:hydantoinase B/oxoprolinase family protein [Halovivax gelatinilyticus]
MTQIPGHEPYTAVTELDESAISGVAFHEPSDEFELDQVTFEVLRNRLQQINEEQGTTLKQVSGSPIVTDAYDFNVTIGDERGNTVSLGPYVMYHASVTDLIIKWILERRSDNPGIEPGDMYICNDPWIGAVHQNDAVVLAPVFYEDELFSWVSSTVHQVDVGGNEIGSFAIEDDDAFAEAEPVPPTKLVEDGSLRADVEDIFLRKSRAPAMVGMDLRAQIAGNNVAIDRIHNLIDDYGPETVKAVLKETMDYAETSLRNRLRELPDGVWRHVDYQEVATADDRGVYRTELALEKDDDTLRFHVDGDGATGMINTTYAGMRGGLVAPVLPMVCHDIPWALGGIYRAIEFEAESNLVVNAEFPAGTGMAAIAGTWHTVNLSNQCVAKMLASSEEYSDDLVAGSSGSWVTMNAMGIDQRGDQFVTQFMDPMAGGWGARSHADGINTAGIFAAPGGITANVESNELAFPMLYMFRKEVPDSGGAGEYRGGLTASMCWLPHGTDAPIQHVISAFGAAAPTSHGVSGGHPSNAVRYELVRDSNAREILESGEIPADVDEIDGDSDVVPPKAKFVQEADDVYYSIWQGGGGYGDPLDRDPERVAADVRAGAVSADAAERTYGVVVTDGEVDEAATAELREEIRTTRLSAEPWGGSDA